MTIPTPNELRRLLHYEPETGKLFWAINHTNKARKGKEALTSCSHGYHRGKIMKTYVRAHRVAWAIYYGEWPKGLIDHINGCPSDNRIQNLRIATDADNAHNSRPRKNFSGLKGVSLHSTSKMWRARIKVNFKELHLGYFKNQESAYAAYCEASKKFHGEYGRVD